MTLDHFEPAATWETLKFRAELLKRVRAFFDERQFVEVETPLLSADTVVDRYIEPIAVDVDDQGNRCKPSGSRARRWLQTSPEFAMKRLVAAGGDAIYQIARAFRAGEVGKLHNVEFTMIEWYRVGDDLERAMSLLASFAAQLLDRGDAEFLTYRDAFERYVGIDPHGATVDALKKMASRNGVTSPVGFESAGYDDWLNLLLVRCVEPNLGLERPIILFDYPATQSMLARIRNDDPPVAERFELYVDGIELANGYHELTDAEELRRRNYMVNMQRESDGKIRICDESRLLFAMEAGLPDCSGVALGFDRLVMLAAGLDDVRDAMAFPFDRA